MDDNTKSIQYLQGLLNKKLCVYTNDSRMFYGDFKCTDNVIYPLERPPDQQLMSPRNATLSYPNPTSTANPLQTL